MHLQSFVVSAALALGGLNVAVPSALAQQTPRPAPVSVADEGETQLTLAGGATFRTTRAQVEDLRTIAVPGSSTLAITWNEVDANGLATSWYAVSEDGGESFPRVTEASYLIQMQHGGAFDPLKGLPEFYSDSPLSGSGDVYFVQYHTQALGAYQEVVRELGGHITGHIVNHTNIVRMSSEAALEVAAQSFVRWVGPYHNEYRLERYLLDALGTGELDEPLPYNIWVFDRVFADQFTVQAKIEQLGGEVRDISFRSSLVGALLTEAQLLEVARMDEVQHIDRYSELEPDMNIARIFSGANYLESQTAFTGQGVRAEVADIGLSTGHPDFQNNGGSPGGPLIHNGNLGSTSHGSPTYGINFGSGTNNAAARGIVPDAFGIFADSDSFGWLNNNNPTNRANHTAQLVDPGNIYKGVYQSNSTGSNRTFFYTTISANMDQIVLDNDVIICQSQSNAGNQDSRPEAWGKNMIGVGGICHNNTLSKSDDAWCGASTGPATDGRIKPDLAHFYDNVFTTGSGSGYTSFSGTSSATPIVAGHFGLFFQMWHNNVFNNNATGATVFDSKPHFETAKAALVATADTWSFSGAGANLNRHRQGFGAPDMQTMYDLRNKTVYRDREMIDALETIQIPINVPAGEPRLKVTMVYRDLPGVVGSNPHRINGIALSVKAPNGTIYHGNNGLLSDNTSSSGGSINSVDTVQNVWIDNPQAGAWAVEVFGHDINTDLYPGTPGNNADFSVWAIGGTESGCTPLPALYCTAKITSSFSIPQIGTMGTPSTLTNDFEITLDFGMPTSTAVCFSGTVQNSTPFNGGFLCVGGTVVRECTTSTDGSGSALCPIPVTAPMVGTTRNFQWWFRDSQDPFGVGLSNGVQVTFCNN